MKNNLRVNFWVKNFLPREKKKKKRVKNFLFCFQIEKRRKENNSLQKKGKKNHDKKSSLGVENFTSITNPPNFLNKTQNNQSGEQWYGNQFSGLAVS